MWHVVFVACVCLTPRAAAAQPFNPVETNIQTTAWGMLVLGDFNRDGHLDVIAANHEFADVYLNNGWGDLSHQSAAPLSEAMAQPLRSNASAFAGDFDNDGDLDVLFSGDMDGTFVYLNDGGANFVRAQAEFPSIVKSGLFDVINTPTLSFSDVDSDGDLDVLVVGYVGDGNGPPISKIFLNAGEDSYAEHVGALPFVLAGPHAWGDFDRDGDPDLVAGCYCNHDEVTTRIFRNDGNGRFADVGIVLLDGLPASVQWGDYDDDGDDDILLAGRTVVEEQPVRSFRVEPFLAIVRNDGGSTSFSLDAQTLPEGAYWARWADMNNNGRLDLLVNSSVRNAPDAPVAALRLFANDNGRFANETATLPPVWNGAIAIGDLDRDGDLDLILSPGTSTIGGDDRPRTLIFRNDSPVKNSAPTAPSSLEAEFIGSDLYLYWAPSSDAETSTASLTYNLRVGITSGGSEIVSPMSLADGSRLVPRAGNVGARNHWVLRGLDPGQWYFWSVQAIDNGLAASPFSEEASLQIATNDDVESLPGRFGLIGNYPNPFNPQTTVRLSLPHAGQVSLLVYSVYGQQVARLWDGLLPAGEHDISFDASGLASGIYVCRLEADGRMDVRPMVLAK